MAKNNVGATRDGDLWDYIAKQNAKDAKKNPEPKNGKAMSAKDMQDAMKMAGNAFKKK